MPFTSHRLEVKPNTPNLCRAIHCFRGATAMEIVDDFDGETYRAVYTVKFAGIVYVLHAFQKKSKKGIATPKHEIALIKSRLKRAQEHFKEAYRTVRLGDDDVVF